MKKKAYLCNVRNKKRSLKLCKKNSSMPETWSYIIDKTNYKLKKSAYGIRFFRICGLSTI